MRERGTSSGGAVAYFADEGRTRIRLGDRLRRELDEAAAAVT